MVQGDMEVLVNLFPLCHMNLESKCIAKNFDDDKNDNKIWQRDDGDHRGAFYVFQNFMDNE